MVAERAFNRISTHRREQLSLPKKGRKKTIKLPVLMRRVSSAENKDNLERQVERLQDYAIVRGYQIYKVVKEIGSGLNDNRPKLAKVLTDYH
jgi:predicted site-specific integrase-resolvase